MKVRGQQQEHGRHGERQPDGQSGLDRLHRRKLAPRFDADSGRRFARLLDRSSDLSGHGSQVGAGDVGGQGDLAPHVVTVELSGHGSRLDRRHVPDQHLPVLGAFQGDAAQLFGRPDGLDAIGRPHQGTRDLDLDLIGDAALRIGPVVGHHEPAGRCRRDQGAGNVGGREARQAGFFAVHIHLDRRVIERLSHLQIAQGRDLGQFPVDLVRMRPVVGEARAADRHFDRRGRAETHDLVDDIRRLEREPDVRHLLCQPRPQAFLQFIPADARTLLQIDVQDHFLGTAGPLIHGVDGKIRMDHSDVAER